LTNVTTSASTTTTTVVTIPVGGIQ
jgi:hypothetical protein